MNRFELSTTDTTTLIIAPSFNSAIVPDYNDGLPIISDDDGEFELIDSEEREENILDMVPATNLLRIANNQCGIVFDKVGKATNRFISHRDFEINVEDCRDKLYRGCWEDLDRKDTNAIVDKFVATTIRMAAVANLRTNKWFGKLERDADPNNVFSWNKMNGILWHAAKYVSQGLVSTSTAIPSGLISGISVINAFDSVIANQKPEFAAMDDSMKVIYVNKSMYRAYSAYVANQPNVYSTYTDRFGRIIKGLYYQDILIKQKPFDDILKALNSGVEAHVCILTVPGNLLYKMNSKYGFRSKENPNEKIGMYAEFQFLKQTWSWGLRLTGGTEILEPKYFSYAITAGLA